MKNKLTLVVDFDGTLALGNASHITAAIPNWSLIEQLKTIKLACNIYIKVVTARGAKANLSYEEKYKKYHHLIAEFLNKYNVPYDEISFNKEYADLYIDDMTIGQFDKFDGLQSYFTKNNIIFTDKTVIKKCSSSLFEKQWYDRAKAFFNVPDVLFCNDETIIIEKISDFTKPTAQDIIDLLYQFKKIPPLLDIPFSTYISRIIIPPLATSKVQDIVQNQLVPHPPTFFHGDLSTTNILKQNTKTWLIDPKCDHVFGSYITDAGKAVFSFIAYEQDFQSAEKIIKEFGEDVIKWAVAEGLRVVKYRGEYISIVNNIADLL